MVSNSDCLSNSPRFGDGRMVIQFISHKQIVDILEKKQTEEKTKVIAAVWGTYLNAALAI